jgi:hypothetical protein
MEEANNALELEAAANELDGCGTFSEPLSLAICTVKLVIDNPAFRVTSTWNHSTAAKVTHERW